MTLKNAALLAFVGMLLLTVVVAVEFIIALSGMLRNIVPAIRLLTSLVHVFAGIAVAVFFYVFQRAQR